MFLFFLERAFFFSFRRGHSEYSSYEILRPGFARLNLPWFASQEQIEFILDALEMIAEKGWTLLPQYR